MMMVRWSLLLMGLCNGYRASWKESHSLASSFLSLERTELGPSVGAG